MRDYPAIARSYCEDIVGGKIPANKWTKLSCQRFLDDLTHAGDPTSPYAFDPEKASRVCAFCEKLRHVKGEWAKQRLKITLEPWQVFILCSLFGMVHRDSGYRKYREALILIPRKQTKTTLAACVSLYMLLADGEAGSECMTGATTLRQSMEVFDCARRMVEISPGLQKAFGVDIWKKTLLVGSTGSKMIPLVRDPGEGSSPHFYCADEVHEHADDTLISAMRTGTGARRQSLGLYISTAGFNLAGPLYSMEKEAQKILSGVVDTPDFFAIMYGIDDDTDPFSLEALRMANPNLNVSVFEADLVASQQKAKETARLTNEFLTKRLNRWVLGSTSWINIQAWKSLGDSTLKPEAFIGCEAFMALDASSKLDITALITVFKKPIDGAFHYYAFPKLFLPEARANDPQMTHYATWVRRNFLYTTPGTIVDLDLICRQAIEDITLYHVKEFAFDPTNATQFANQISKETPATIIEIPQQIRYMSDPMKTTEALVLAGRLHHPDNDCFTWNFSNVTCKPDNKNLQFPRKDNNEAKIDAAVATIMCIARASLNAKPQSNVGLFFV